MWISWDPAKCNVRPLQMHWIIHRYNAGHLHRLNSKKSEAPVISFVGCNCHFIWSVAPVCNNLIEKLRVPNKEKKFSALQRNRKPIAVFSRAQSLVPALSQMHLMHSQLFHSFKIYINIFPTMSRLSGRLLSFRFRKNPYIYYLYSVIFVVVIIIIQGRDFPHTFRLVFWGPRILLCNEQPVSFRRKKRQGSGVNHTPQSSADVRGRLDL